MPKPTHPPLQRILRNTGGLLLVLLGIVGLFLPFLQGILFIVLGLALIDVPQKHRLHRWLQARSRAYRWLALKHHAVKRLFLRRRRRAARRRTG